MKSILTITTLLATLSTASSSFADPACEAFPKCGEFTCVNYINGDWKDANGAAVTGAYITTEDFKTFQLFVSSDGTTSGDITKILASCTR